MQDTPDADALLEAVSEFLRQHAAPQLQGQSAFHARVAANLVDAVRRQMALAPSAEADERRRLRALLASDGSLLELNRLLCQRIASGEMDWGTPGLKEHLRATTMDKLAVDQPGYSTYRRLLADGKEQS